MTGKNAVQKGNLIIYVGLRLDFIKFFLEMSCKS